MKPHPFSGIGSFLKAPERSVLVRDGVVDCSRIDLMRFKRTH
jgi:hypothetical protein